MSGQKPSKSGFLTAPLRKLFKGSSKRSAQTTPSPSPSPSPQPGPIASSIPSVGPNSAAASNVSVVLVSESWWSKNREEIVASVRQVLNVAKEALDGVPVPGLKAAVGGLTEGLKVFQTKWGNDKSLMDLKEEIKRVFAIIRPYTSPDSTVPPEMAERMRALAKSISGLEQEWVEQTSKHVVRQHLSAESISEDVKDITRKLATSISHAMLEGGLRTEAAVSNVATTVSDVQTTVSHVQTTVSNIESKQAAETNDRQHEILQRLVPVKSAFHNAAGSPSGCLEGTRVDLLAQIDEWLDDDSATRPRVLWLNGLAGTGKTTIAYSVATTAEKRNMLAASYFFSRDHHERRRLASIVPTIAYQLALWRDELRGPICNAVSENPDIADQLMTKQVDTLLVRSFEKSPLRSKPSCTLLILDALDECDKENGIEGGELLPLLIQSLFKIPFPVKILVTSRPEPSIRMMLNEPKMIGPTHVFVPNVFELHAVASNIVAADIGLYLTSEFKRIARRQRMPLHAQAWPAQHEIDALVALATPLFVFASTVIRFIDSNVFLPRRQLDLILHSDATERPAASFYNLDRLYMDVLLAIIAGQSEVDVICGRFQRIMGAILSVLEPASVALLSSLLSMDKEEVEYALRPLSAVLNIPTDHDPNHVIRIFHPSFPEFMTHPKRCGDHRFFINTRESHALLAQACLATFTERLLATQGGSLNNPASSSKLGYAQSYWLSHLLSALSPSPEYEVSKHLQASPDAFCMSAIMQFLTSGDMGPTPHAVPGKMSFVLRDIVQHSHVVVLYMEKHCFAAAIIPQSHGQPVNNIHILRLTADLESEGRVSSILPRPSQELTAVWAWRTVVEPIFSLLKLEPQAGRQRPRVHWCCLGQTRTWRLHAALVDLRNDAHGSRLFSTSYAGSSYVPNLAALLALHGATRVWAVSDIQTCVAFRNRIYRYWGSDLGSRPTSFEEETALVARILPQAEGIVTPTRSAKEALNRLTNSHIFHYAGYGSASRKPMDCAFLLDSELKIYDIVRTPLRHPVLAYLCPFSLTSSDATHDLATSMLLAGFKSIVTTTTTSLHDDDGPIFAEEFYRSWLANGRDGLVSLQDIPYALDDACAALRAAGKDADRWGVPMHIGA